MDDIYRLHLTVTSGFAYRAKIDFKNPGQSDWKRSGNLANVSLGISKEVYLKDVSGIQDGAAVRFVMDIRLGRTVVASEIFVYKKNSDYYATYNGTRKNISNPKSVFKGRSPSFIDVADFKGRLSTAINAGEASALFLKVTGGYAYKVKIQYRKDGNSSWNTTNHIVSVTAGIPEMVNISDVDGINSDYQFRFVMDVVAGYSNVIANEYFTYKKDITAIARYCCKGTTLNPRINYNGVKVYSPVDFSYDLDKQKINAFANENAKEEKFRNFSIYSKDDSGLFVNGCVRVESCNLADIMLFKNNGRIALITAEKKKNQSQITTYASGPKDNGVGHIWFIDKDYNCYEEDVFLYGELAKKQSTDCCRSNADIIYISWNDKLMGGDPILRSITANGQFQDFFKTVGFESVVDKDTGRRFYHAMVDCLQRRFGYCDLYDEVFNYATTMEFEKFEFLSQGKKYIFWTWKGYYLNLGAGAEMGFYEFVKRMSLKELTDKMMEGISDFFKEHAKYMLPALPFTELTAKTAFKKILSMVATNDEYDYYESISGTPTFRMKLVLAGKNNLPRLIHSYEPTEKQWWITTFVPYLQGVNPKDLAPEYTVWIDEEHTQLINDFDIACDQKPEMKGKWRHEWIDGGVHTLVHTFE